jgi:hypothetical protein
MYVHTYMWGGLERGLFAGHSLLSAPLSISLSISITTTQQQPKELLSVITIN